METSQVDHSSLYGIDLQPWVSAPGTPMPDPIDLPWRHHHIPTPIVPTREDIIDVPVKPAGGQCPKQVTIFVLIA